VQRRFEINVPPVVTGCHLKKNHHLKKFLVQKKKAALNFERPHRERTREGTRDRWEGQQKRGKKGHLLFQWDNIHGGVQLTDRFCAGLFGVEKIQGKVDLPGKAKHYGWVKHSDGRAQQRHLKK